MMGALGHKVLESFISPVCSTEESEPILYMNYAQAQGHGKRTNDGFVVFKGSKINPTTTNSCQEYIIQTRKKYESIISADYKITEDILFNSPSAAGFLSGTSVNGNKEWKNNKGISLKELEAQK